MAMGQAAGQATKQVVKKRVAFNDIDIKTLQTELRANACMVTGA